MSKRIVITVDESKKLDDPKRVTHKVVSMTPEEEAEREQMRVEAEAEHQRRQRKEQRIARAATRAKGADFTALLTALNNSKADNGVKLILRQIVNNQIDIMNLLGVSDHDPEA